MLPQEVVQANIAISVAQTTWKLYNESQIAHEFAQSVNLNRAFPQRHANVKNHVSFIQCAQ